MVPDGTFPVLSSLSLHDGQRPDFPKKPVIFCRDLKDHWVFVRFFVISKEIKRSILYPQAACQFGAGVNRSVSIDAPSHTFELALHPCPALGAPTAPGGAMRRRNAPCRPDGVLCFGDVAQCIGRPAAQNTLKARGGLVARERSDRALRISRRPDPSPAATMPAVPVPVPGTNPRKNWLGGR